MPEHKVLVGITVAALGAAVIVVDDLQSSGMELPSWVSIAATIVGSAGMYLKRNGNLAPSTIDAATGGG